ncbi:MAG: hypothetical protein IIZ92_26835 [Aquincola sp.]|nr:hypothetical protein [Aquincola sp.]
MSRRSTTIFGCAPFALAVSNAAGKVTHAVERVTLTNAAARTLAAIPADELPYAQMPARFGFVPNPRPAVA